MNILKTCLCVAAVLVTGACCKSESVSVTLLHYNVGVFDKYSESSLESVAGVVKGLNADVVSMNEVDSCTVRTGQVDQLVAFAEAMGGWNHHYASSMPYDGGAYGVGVVSSPSMEIVHRDKVALPRYDGREPRVMAVVEYKDFVFASTHLDLTPESQLGQMEVINNYIDRRYSDSGKPVVLCGDFNCEPDSEPLLAFKESWTLLSPSEYTYPSPEPVKCIDYIFVRPNGGTVKVESAEVPAEVAGQGLDVVSDHLPVVVKITIK